MNTLKKNNWSSFFSIVFVQTLNAFNDNFVRLTLTYAIKSAAVGVVLKSNITNILSGVIPICFILFAPLAGFLADRYSKKSILLFTAIAQFGILLILFVAVINGHAIFCIIVFVLLSIQSVFVGPAKLGIQKELVKDEKLSFANGLMYATTMLAIIIGMSTAGKTFAYELQKLGDPWLALKTPIGLVMLFSIAPIIILFFIKKTPTATKEKFRISLLYDHFGEIKLIFRDKRLRRVAVGIMLYWFLAYYMGILVIDIASSVYSNDNAKVASESSKMLLYISCGTALGSIFIMFLSRNKLKIGIVFYALIGMSLSIGILTITDFCSNYYYFALALLGFFSGIFLIPLNTALQLWSHRDVRGRVIATSSLLSSFAGLVAVSLSFLEKAMKFSAIHQLYTLTVIIIIGTIVAKIWLRKR